VSDHDSRRFGTVGVLQDIIVRPEKAAVQEWRMALQEIFRLDGIWAFIHR
jgi:hypothetical protein